MANTKRQPAYLRVYRDLRKKIENNHYKLGMLLPPESELEAAYQVSRTTVRHAVALLLQDQLVTVKQGYGTEIIRNKTSQCMNNVTSVSQSLRERGYDVGVQQMYIEKATTDFELSQELHVPVGTPVIAVFRVQTANGEPITIARNYILEDWVPGLSDETEKITSLYQYLNDKYSIQITQLEDRLSACNATLEESALLNVDPRTALITVRRICYAQETPFEVDFVKIVASKYEYKNYLK